MASMMSEMRAAFTGVVTMVTTAAARSARRWAMSIIGIMWPGAMRGPGRNAADEATCSRFGSLRNNSSLAIDHRKPLFSNQTALSDVSKEDRNNAAMAAGFKALMKRPLVVLARRQVQSYKSGVQYILDA
ncbi:hypothetical protein HPP92_005166 [Vanilla planifolia]|uniref:Uncharacterized protein n=1 Tax=Vanilla planifolia TaxID=51239 RepID=A0A835VBX5_VANPL|nr:hypothetical protein HPP92_005166 [Vanilla planifolia]